MLEQTKNSQPHILASPSSKPESAESSLPPTVTQSELSQLSSKSVQVEDVSLSATAPPSSVVPSKPSSTTERANEPQTIPTLLAQSSTAAYNYSVVQSESSAQPDATPDNALSSVPPLSLQAPKETAAPTHTAQTSSLPSSDLTKSGPPVQSSQPFVLEPSSLDAKNSLSRLQVSKVGTAIDQAPPSGVEVGVTKAEPAVISRDSPVGLKKEAVSGSMAAEGRATEKGGDSSVAEEELLRMMHPSIVAG